MYCKYCGKQIEEDSLFCRYCGRHLGLPDKKIVVSSFKILRRFQSLSTRVQFFIIAYIVYFLICLCCLIDNSEYDIAGATISFIICVLILPFVAICGYYFWGKYKQQKEGRGKQNISCEKGYNKICKTKFELVASSFRNVKYGKKKRLPIQSVPLLLFAKSHGTMQVVDDKDNPEEPKHYCLFEPLNGNSVKVVFAKKIGVLTAEEIARRKHELFVNLYANGIYELDI